MTRYSTDTDNVVSVWSAYGHRFMIDNGENTQSCLTCGATYQLLAFADDPTHGAYLGDERRRTAPMQRRYVDGARLSG